jgi:hypothetical protein
MIQSVDEWNTGPEPDHLNYSIEQIKAFSPDNLSIVEFGSQKDLDISSRMYANSPSLDEFLSDDVSGGREFHVSEDAHLYKDREKWIKEGFERQGNGILSCEEGDEAVPFYIGEMIHQFDFSYQGVKDEETIQIPHSSKKILAEDYMSRAIFREEGLSEQQIRICYRGVSRSADTRSMICALTPDFPAGHSIMMPKGMEDGIQKLALPGIFNSFAFDYLLRQKVTYNVSWYILKEIPIPDFSEDEMIEVAEKVARLNWHPDYFPDLEEYTNGILSTVCYETDSEERARIREELDRIMMEAYSLTDEE